MKIDILKSVHELVGLGLTWEHASAAVRYFDRMSEDIRKKQAENKRIYRSARKATALARPLNTTSISSSELKEKPREVVIKKESKRKKSISPFPEDFIPNDRHYARGASLGFSPAKIDALAEDIKLWAVAKGERKACWDSAFHRWIRTEGEKRGQQNAQPTLNQVINRIGQRASNMQPGNSGAWSPPALGIISGGKAE